MTVLASVINQVFRAINFNATSLHIDSIFAIFNNANSIFIILSNISIIKIVTLKNIIIYDDSNTRYRLE